MFFNPAKCEAVLVRDLEKLLPSKHPYKTNDNIHFAIGQERITVKDDIKYLGIIINKKLSTLPQVNAAVCNANLAMIKLKRIFGNKYISSRTKVILYKQLIRPLLAYGFPAWCWISSNQMRRLRACESRCLYKCLPYADTHFLDRESGCFYRISKRKLFRAIGKIERLDAFLLKGLLKTLEKLEHDPSPFLCAVTSASYLSTEMEVNWRHFKFKKFPPSLIWMLHVNESLYGPAGEVTFFNRRYNSREITSDDLVYDCI